MDHSPNNEYPLPEINKYSHFAIFISTLWPYFKSSLPFSSGVGWGSRYFLSQAKLALSAAEFYCINVLGVILLS